MKRNSKLLGAMDMSHRGRIGDNDVGNEEVLGVFHKGSPYGLTHAIPCLDTAPPAAIDDFSHLLATLTDISGLDTLSIRQQTGISDHVRHEGLWITTDAEELDTLALDKILEHRMSTNAHPVIVRGLDEALSNGDKRLDIASGANNVYGDVEAGDAGGIGLGSFR